MNNDASWSTVESLRSIFTIVLALSLGEAFKQFVADRAADYDKTGTNSPEANNSIRWDCIPALLSFLLLLIPFYQGMARHLYISYKTPSLSESYGRTLLLDVLVFTAEASLFFVMSRAVRIAQWRRFYWAVFCIIAVDTCWACFLWKTTHRPSLWPWLISDIVALPICLVILLTYRKPDSRIGPAVALIAMLVRTVFDYSTSWDFYFPPATAQHVVAAAGNGDPTSDAIKIYFAAPLFTQAEWRWNAAIAAELRRLGCDVILPQERAEPMLNGDVAFDAPGLFAQNVADIDRADVVFAVLDGADADSGTSWEIGYAFKIGRPVVGLRTDIRSGGDDGKAPVNLMLSNGCSTIIVVPLNKRNDIQWASEQLAKWIRDNRARLTKDHQNSR